MDYNPNTRIIDLTVGQLLEIIGSTGQKKEEPIHEKKYEYGIPGIARIFNCSITTANRIKKSGRINEAIKQSGRLIIVDVERAIELYYNK